MCLGGIGQKMFHYMFMCWKAMGKRGHVEVVGKEGCVEVPHCGG